MAATRIRDARPGEAAALEELQRAASLVWPAYREALLAHPEVIALPESEIAAGRVRVAEDQHGAPVGFSLVVEGIDGVDELDGLFVAPEHQRGEGIGRALVEDACARAAARGASALEVVQGPETDGFYARMGFTPIAQERTRFGPARRCRRSLG